MAMKGETSYFTCRRNRVGKQWRIYRVVENCPDYPDVHFLEEPASKYLPREQAEHLTEVLNKGVEFCRRNARWALQSAEAN